MTQSDFPGATCRSGSKGSSRFKVSLNRRFSDAEQMAFGRFTHLNIRSRFAGGIPTMARVSSDAAILGRVSDLGLQSSEAASSGLPSPTGLPAISQDRMSHSAGSGSSTNGGKRRKRANSASGERKTSCAGDPELQELLQKLLPTDRALPLPWEVDVEQETQPPPQQQSKHLTVRSQPRPLSSTAPGSMSKQSSTASRELAATVSTGPNFCRDAGVPGGGTAANTAQPADARSEGGCSSQTSGCVSRPSRPPKPGSQRAQSPGVSPRHRVKVLDRFRFEILQRFRSLFDAFNRLHDLATRENSLKREEFCQVFEMFGIKESDSAEVFEVMDFKQLGSVSLAHLRSVLAAGTRQAVLWELRCRLLVHGITPNDLAKVRKILEVARRPRHRTVRQQRWRAEGGYIVPQKVPICSNTSAQESDGDESSKEENTSGWAEAVETKSGAWRVGFRPTSTQLSRTDWLHVCAAIGLTLLEAERLFDEIGDAQTGMFDLTEMFNALRSGVAPHVSLERFATRVLTRYGSFEAAFSAIFEKPSKLVHWKEFHKLAVLLDVEDRNAARLWNVLCLAQRSLHDEDGQNSKDGTGDKEGGTTDAQGLTAAVEPQDCGGIQEDTFVKELTIWAPATAMDALKHQVSELFNSPGEFRYALEQGGIACGSSVSVSSLQAALQSVGIVGCDAERLLRAVASSREPTRRRGVCLEDIISVMQGNDDFHAHTAVRDDFQPVWQQALTVQAALRDPNPDAWQHWSLNRAAAPQNDGARPKYGGRSFASFRRSASLSSLPKERKTDSL